MQHVEQQSGKTARIIERFPHRHPMDLDHMSAHTLGTRAAGWVATGAGSWAFIIAYLIFTAAYTLGHRIGVFHFDPYPYQFYTFLVSVLAILLAQIILLFQNRQAELETKIAHNAYNQVSEIDSMQKTQLRILEQLQKMTTEMHALRGAIDEHVDSTN